MKKSALIALTLSCIGLSSLTLAHSSWAQSPQMRLIETAPGRAHWMRPSDIDALSDARHTSGHCGGYMDITDFQDDPVSLHMTDPTQFDLFADRDPWRQELVEQLLPELSPAELLQNVRHLSSYYDRFYQSETGVKSATWIRDRLAGLASHRSDVKVELVTHNFKQPSVIATITGTHPTLKNEIVVIGGHLDSINQYSWGSQAQAPGADDNASGTSTVMEIFRVIVESGYQPQRTLQFMGYAGEEKGLLGSQDIARRYKQEGKRVVAAMQFDMTFFPGSTEKLTFITDFTDPSLTRFSQKLMDTYVKMPWVTDTCGYACSDHASWTKNGYASAFPFEAPSKDMNSKIHTTADTIVNGLDADFGLLFAKLGLAFALESTAEKSEGSF
jgi:leucyl aminopeptidase